MDHACMSSRRKGPPKKASIGRGAKAYNEIGKNVKFGKSCVLRNFIFIGDNCTFGDRVRISNYCNIDRGCKIGNDVNFQTGVYLAADTIVGDNSFFAAHTAVADEKYPAVGLQIRKPVVFGKNVVIGIGAKIIGGITIGDNAVIGMMSSVTKDVPADEVWVGNPAKPIISKDTGRAMTRQEYNSKKVLWEEQIGQT